MFDQLVSSHAMRHFTLLEEKPSFLQDFQTEVSNVHFHGQASDLKIVPHENPTEQQNGARHSMSGQYLVLRLSAWGP